MTSDRPDRVFSVEVPAAVEPSEVVAAFPGVEDVIVIKEPDCFAVFVGVYVYSTPGEEDADFAAAVSYAASEASRIHRANA